MYRFTFLIFIFPSLRWTLIMSKMDIFRKFAGKCNNSRNLPRPILELFVSNETYYFQDLNVPQCQSSLKVIQIGKLAPCYAFSCRVLGVIAFDEKKFFNSLILYGFSPYLMKWLILRKKVITKYLLWAGFLVSSSMMQHKSCL